MNFIFDEEDVFGRKERYVALGRLGQGSFGEVRMGSDTFTGKSVALKYVRILSQERGGIPRAVFRELESLKQLKDSDYIAQLLDYFPDESNLCLVMEYLPTDLQEVIQKATCPLPAPQVKAFAHMLLSALSYCHSKRIIHRDIKPANILLSEKGQLKLGDFGLARAFDPASNDSLSHQVSTRWYRAPELLFASRHYNLAVDVWSAGAVIAELFSLFPLFPGTNDIDQIYRVFQVMGSPSEETWEGVNDLPDYSKVSFPMLQPVDFKILIPHAGSADIEFFLSMLCLDPAKRASAEEAKNSSYFRTYPSPCSLSELPVPSRSALNPSKHLLKKGDNMDTFLANLLV